MFAAARPIPIIGPGAVPWTDDWSGAQITVTDLLNDGALTLFLAGASATTCGRTSCFKRARAVSSGWRTIRWRPCREFCAAAWGDYDNDGLTDVYFCRAGANQLWRQTAAGQWQDVTEATGTAGGDLETIDAQFFDADHDGDLDLFLANDGPNELLSNNLDGTFRPLAVERGLTGNGQRSLLSVAVDLDRDRDQ